MAPRGPEMPLRRATPPSRMSSVPAKITSQPARKIAPRAKARPASTLTPSCAQVSASGWTRIATSCSSSGRMSPRYQSRRRAPRSGAPGPAGASGTGVWAMPRNASAMAAPMTRAATRAVPGRQAGVTVLPFDLSPQELLDPLLREVVGELLGRVLHQIGRDADQRAADAAVTRHAAAADRVDDAAPGVGAVLDREPQLELDRRVAEAAALHAHERDLVVALPGDVVARADVDHLRRQRFR